jgi:hypothetical protein
VSMGEAAHQGESCRRPCGRQLVRWLEDLIVSTGPAPVQHLSRGWRSVIFAPAGDGQRRRRGSDGVRLAAAAVAVVCCLLVIRYNSRIDQAIAGVIHPPPQSITWLVTVVYEAGSSGVAIVLVLVAVVARRWDIARDIGVSAAVTAAATVLLIVTLGGRDGHRDHHPGPRTQDNTKRPEASDPSTAIGAGPVASAL